MTVHTFHFKHLKRLKEQSNNNGKISKEGDLIYIHLICCHYLSPKFKHCVDKDEQYVLYLGIY